MKTARCYVVRGTVQGVGFRYFVKQVACELELLGMVRNLDDGSVEVIAMGNEEQLSRLSGHLRLGPRGASVRGVEEREAPVGQYKSFSIAH